MNHVGQLQAVTVTFNLAPGVALGDATNKLEHYRDEIKLPESVITSYGGDAAVFKSSQGSQAILIVAALLVIYVLLGVLYESYIHPITILAGLPSAAAGALLMLWLVGLDLTLIATLGVLLLIGIVKKNAIMMIDFALDAQRTRGMAPEAAIREACGARARRAGSGGRAQASRLRRAGPRGSCPDGDSRRSAARHARRNRAAPTRSRRA